MNLAKKLQWGMRSDDSDEYQTPSEGDDSNEYQYHPCKFKVNTCVISK